MMLDWLDCCCCCCGGVVCCCPGDVPAPAPPCAYTGTDHATVQKHMSNTSRARRILISKKLLVVGWPFRGELTRQLAYTDLGIHTRTKHPTPAAKSASPQSHS